MHVSKSLSLSLSVSLRMPYCGACTDYVSVWGAPSGKNTRGVAGSKLGLERRGCFLLEVRIAVIVIIVMK